MHLRDESTTFSKAPPSCSRALSFQRRSSNKPEERALVANMNNTRVRYIK